MKICIAIGLILLLLSGCGAATTFETISDEYVQPAAVTMRQLQLSLPEDVAVTTFGDSQSGTLYLCDGYSIAVQTMASGDLDRTVRSISGFSRDSIALIQTEAGLIDRYECVWVSAGEANTQMCRACILDDGNYHYTVSLMADADRMRSVSDQWQSIMASVSVGTD